MFTGLIEQQGEVVLNRAEKLGNRLQIRASFEQLQAGESISVNGVCLTLLPDFAQDMAFDVSPETLKLTALAKLKPGDEVNLERAMIATTRFGGHYVSGHVDTTANVRSLAAMGDYIKLVVDGFEPAAIKYLLVKGSIALDGVSLTINAVENNGISLLLVPHTIAKTTLGQRRAGDFLNVEFDYFTRIIAHQLSSIDLSTWVASK